jgi:leader peptidase (prepilin peptidase) / N-methyltransferase
VSLTVPLFDLNLVFSAGLAVLGLIVGSFLNVVIARLPHQESIVSPRSRCPSCGHQLPWFENIPVASWLILRARCSNCRARISWRYPAVELITAILLLACLHRYGWTWELVIALTLVTLLIPLTFIDLDHWILPFSLTLPGIAFGLLLSIPRGWEHVRAGFLGALLGFLAFWMLEWVGLRIFKKEALGGGDKYLLALLGAFLGYRSLLGLVFLASIQGAIAGTLLLLLFGRAGPLPAEHQAPVPPPPDQTAERSAAGEQNDWTPGPHNLPFGPWLSLAAIELMLFGPWLADRLPFIIAQWFVGPS